MSHLIQAIKRSCVFVLQVQNPTETLRKLALFFLDRHIPIDNLNMHSYKCGDAMLIIYCQIERDRIIRTVQLLEQLPGVVELERLEER